MFTELGELVVVTPKGSRYFEEVPLRLAPQVRRAAHGLRCVERQSCTPHQFNLIIIFASSVSKQKKQLR